MADQTRPPSPDQVQDPSRTYERARPEVESGMGSLHGNPDAVPTSRPDEMAQPVTNKQPPRQRNAEDETNERLEAQPTPEEDPSQRLPPPAAVDHSMLEEEPDGWDLAPNETKSPRQRRHPRTEGRGGTP